MQHDNTDNNSVKSSMHAAHSVKSAAKTGKAISGAAKGIASAGPLGAAIGFAVSNPKLFRKILLGVIAITLIPILFICMLPCIIFGSLINAFSPSDPDTPILNSSTVISQNMAAISSTINSVLTERLNEILIDIENDFKSSSAAYKELINTYDSADVNANRFISQYCAYRNQDYQSVSIDDMSNILRQNRDKLYSWTRTFEDREKTTTTVTTDPDTGEEVETTVTTIEKWAIYTITYNGESYFADNIFHLSAEQKALAKDYADNLAMFLKDFS